MTDDLGYCAFVGGARIASGSLADVAAAVRRACDAEPNAAAQVFDRTSGKAVDLDLRGTEAEVRARHAPPAARGRPKLGVTAREVTLLPRHWDWLQSQPGGASVALRRLVDAARKDAAEQGRARQEAAYRFMSALAGDMPGFEEASRALFAGDRAGLEARMAEWPADIRAEVLALLSGL